MVRAIVRRANKPTCGSVKTLGFIPEHQTGRVLGYGVMHQKPGAFHVVLAINICIHNNRTLAGQRKNQESPNSVKVKHGSPSYKSSFKCGSRDA